ncbi:MAG: hypothetical protein U5N86_00700 [Planctomycetota bacterium]|nr:hypothetical protein [Planctomycetota bacterium]
MGNRAGVGDSCRQRESIYSKRSDELRRGWAILLTIALLFSATTSCAEDARVPYPFGENLLDITDKVTISGPETIEFETWDLTKETPPALDDGIQVKPRDEWNSYPDGAETPKVNYSFERIHTGGSPDCVELVPKNWTGA